MDVASFCALGSDNQIGPRVDPACRSFDFTLQFEDAFFVILPAGLFVMLLPLQLRTLWTTPVKMTSYRLAVWKSGTLATLFVFQLLFLVFRVQSPNLYTGLSFASGALSATATLGALGQSFLEDQRSVKPSDLLVFYYSMSTLLAVPCLRTLWLVPSENLAKAFWTIIFLLSIGVVFVESRRKTSWIRPAYKRVSSEETASFWSRSFFIWVLPFVRVGYSHVLKLQDMPDIDHDLEESATWTKLEGSWQHSQGCRLRLVRATLVANAWPFFSAVVPRLALSAFLFSQPFLINAAVSHLSDSSGENYERYGQSLIGAFILAYLGIAVSRAVYWRQTYRMLARIRVGLTTKIYRHTINLQGRQVEDSAALTLMGTDVERIVESLNLVHEVWASIPEVAIGIWLLARQLSYASLVPVVICLASIAASSVIAKYFGPAQKYWVKRVEKRVSATASMLGEIRAVKMLGLTDNFDGIIRQLRDDEMQVSEKFRRLRIWTILVGNTPVTFAPFATLAAYAIMAVTTGDDTLLAAQAFSSLALISLVTDPLLQFCQALPSLAQAISSFGRIEVYLSITPVTLSDQLLETGEPVLLESLQAPRSSLDPLVEFRDADISWSPQASRTVLHNVNLSIRRGFTAFIGPVGSGKSTLLASIVGECSLIRGSASSNWVGVGLCTQNPWIIDDTIRQNIVGGAEFDQKWYEFCITSCCLRQDLESMPAGDLTVVGTNGSSLSGGQRQRVTIARAIFSRLPILILDDVMSGLDPTTAREITSNLFSKEGYLRKAGVSVILATHDLRILSLMDTIIALDHHSVAVSGSYAEMRERMPEIFSQVQDPQSSEEQTRENGMMADMSLKTADLCSGSAGLLHRPLSVTTTLSDKRRQSGNWSVYAYYIKSAGIATSFIWLLSTLAGAVVSSGSTLWVDAWTQANMAEGNQNVAFYLGIYFLLVALGTLFLAAECWAFFIRIINDTAIKLHGDLLMATLRQARIIRVAPLGFFQMTGTGEITNRFSQDMNLIDMTLPSQAIRFTTGFASSLVQLIILSILGKYLAATIPILAAALFLVQRFYLRTSRQVRLLDIETKAPLYTHFLETIRGISTIRAFRWEFAFQDKLGHLLNQSQKPFYMLFCIQQWLTLILDLMVGALAVVLVILAINLTGSLSPGALGVALVLILQFNGLLIQTIQSWTKLETSIGAVARVQDFVQESPSEPTGVTLDQSSWPVSGSVQFNQVVASYAPNTAPVLSSLTLSIAAGEKVAICGPSGSGKTSSIMAMLKMLDVSSGRIFIDGTDIATLQGEWLRSQVNVIPQEPFFMPGSIRFNLDPKKRAASLSCVEDSVRKVGLWDKVMLRGGIDAYMARSEWSHGELQLLCLARALLVPSRILVLDEAMSSVDEQTEAVMQEVIDTQFQDTTVISVIHRYRYIDRYDRVALLKDGRLVECDEPSVLLKQEMSAFRELHAAVDQ
ncbi:P-loop containing nucleoside triphosphate hydrolase protein [Hypoxylon cercidicola]|nr:P-loop containing nucleoside triphosphate hydrolase protein [Hypoxylon cercidicola]